MKTKMQKMKMTPQLVKSWKHPPFQRNLRVNAKVMKLAEELKNPDHDGQLPGVITLGDANGTLSLIDGQHRIEAFLMSELESINADVRTIDFDDKNDMGEEFVQLNSSLVSLKPDHILKGLLPKHPGMKMLIKRHDFIGFEQIRRGEYGPILSMSTVLRCWFGSTSDTPKNSGTGTNATTCVNRLIDSQAEALSDVLERCVGAWGTGKDSHRLWNALNLTLVMWLWRRVVVGTSNGTRATTLSPALFEKCLAGLAADANYVQWLQGRVLNEHSRGPCYERMRAIFNKRYRHETGKNIIMPSTDLVTGELHLRTESAPIDFDVMMPKLKSLLAASPNGLPMMAITSELGVLRGGARKLLMRGVEEGFVVSVGERSGTLYMKK